MQELTVAYRGYTNIDILVIVSGNSTKYLPLLHTIQYILRVIQNSSDDRVLDWEPKGTSQFNPGFRS